MSLMVKIYSMMPAGVKELITRVYIALRHHRELAAARNSDGAADSEPRVVYITGFPRSATTMLKYYFAGYPGLQQTAFTPVGFFSAWEKSADTTDILVDKSNHYIYSCQTLFAGCGHGARVVVIIRDPRDCLVSFARYQENREVPRDKRYWRYWSNQHGELLRFLCGSEFAKNFFLLRYEDLVRFPKDAKAAFLQWLGKEVTAEDLDRNYRNDHPGEGWNDSVHEYREVGAHALQKWQTSENLPTWCVDRLAQWADDQEVVRMMRLFGYSEDGFGTPELQSEDFVFYRPQKDS